MEEGGGGEDMNIRVVVRCRPFNTKERNNGETSIVKITEGVVTLSNPAGNNEDHNFSFDSVFGPDCLQSEVWEVVGLPILDKAIAGYNGTIFAYGQTGSGKTWSMQGGEEDLRGIIPRMSVSLFDKVANEKQSRPTIQFLITVSYFEIYNEVIFDLLDASDRKKRMGNNKGGLEIKEHPALGVYVKGLQEMVVEDGFKLQGIIDQGMRNRTVASTQMNADSSRSHSVFMITVHQKDTDDESRNIFAKINLVDLAGSERVKSTGATGATLKEGANINKSLSALGNVINALVEAGKGKNTFIPYRNSKLTRVLQESLGGNSITTMLAALSPAACNFEETLSTLKYANRAKAIKVLPLPPFPLSFFSHHF
jgi:kinesin family protein 1/kinesin family protein 3/17